MMKPAGLPTFCVIPVASFSFGASWSVQVTVVPRRSALASPTTGKGRTKTSILGGGSLTRPSPRAAGAKQPSAMGRGSPMRWVKSFLHAGSAGGGAIRGTWGFRFRSVSSVAMMGSTFGVCEIFHADSEPTAAISPHAPQTISLSIRLTLHSCPTDHETAGLLLRPELLHLGGVEIHDLARHRQQHAARLLAAGLRQRLRLLGALVGGVALDEGVRHLRLVLLADGHVGADQVHQHPLLRGRLVAGIEDLPDRLRHLTIRKLDGEAERQGLAQVVEVRLHEAHGLAVGAGIHRRPVDGLLVLVLELLPGGVG